LKWQSLSVFFKKRSRSRTLWISGGTSIFAVFAMVLMLTGVTITSSGDIIAGTDWEVYVNITSTYWRICFNDTNFSPLYFDTEPLSYEVFVPARGKDNWRPLVAGDCIERKNKYNVLPNRFKIVGTKNSWETIKYGVKVMNEDLDPFIYSENVVLVDKIAKYEKKCTPVIKGSLEFKPVLSYKLTEFNKTCEVVDGKCNTTITNYVTYWDEEQVGCKTNGIVKDLIKEKEIKRDGFFCGVNNDRIECDIGRDSTGGFGDSDMDGVCDAGETCIIP